MDININHEDMGMECDVLFRIPFTIYFLARVKHKLLFLLLRKRFNSRTGYYWEVV